jgi:hypothetical protein
MDFASLSTTRPGPSHQVKNWKLPDGRDLLFFAEKTRHKKAGMKSGQGGS